MENISEPTNMLPVPLVRHRSWSEEDKLKMLKEAEEPGSSFSAVARKNFIQPNQLFIWRKQLANGYPSSATANVSNSNNLYAEYKSALSRIDELEDLHKLAIQELTKQLRIGKISGYNASCATANLVTSRVKLTEHKLQLIDTLNGSALLNKTEIEDKPEQTDSATQRASEKLLVSLVRKQLEHDKVAS